MKIKNNLAHFKINIGEKILRKKIITFLTISFFCTAIVTSLFVGHNTGEHRKDSIKGREEQRNEDIKKGHKNSDTKEFFYLVKKTKPGLLKKNKKNILVTAYYKPEKDEKDYEKKVEMNGTGEWTSTGTVPEIGTLAADHRYYPAGTRFYFPEFGICEVSDKGRDIKGPHRLDIFVGSGKKAYKKAMNIGRQKMIVLILPPSNA
jgi:3D (Asp-Asp-Asp) domain-containing protein